MFRKASFCHQRLAAKTFWWENSREKGVVSVQQIVKQHCFPERSNNFDGGILSEKMQVSGFGRGMIKTQMNMMNQDVKHLETS